MDKLKLQAFLNVRVSTKLKRQIQLEAQRLGVRPADVIRMTLAQAVFTDIPVIMPDDTDDTFDPMKPFYRE